jgi:hypothetical protein
MAHQPAVHHDHQRPGGGRRKGRGHGRTGGQPGLGLPLGPFARRLHLPMDEGVIHRHSHRPATAAAGSMDGVAAAVKHRFSANPGVTF